MQQDMAKISGGTLFRLFVDCEVKLPKFLT